LQDAFHKTALASSACRSPIEMSPLSPIEMSPGHAVVETFGVTSDGGDPDERARTDPVACADRSGGQPADSRGGWHLDRGGASSGLSPAPCFRLRRTDGVGLAEAWSGEQSPASRDVSSNRSDPGPAALLGFRSHARGREAGGPSWPEPGRRDTAAVDDRRRAVERSPASPALPTSTTSSPRLPG